MKLPFAMLQDEPRGARRNMLVALHLYVFCTEVGLIGIAFWLAEPSWALHGVMLVAYLKSVLLIVASALLLAQVARTKKDWNRRRRWVTFAACIVSAIQAAIVLDFSAAVGNAMVQSLPSTLGALAALLYLAIVWGWIMGSGLSR